MNKEIPQVSPTSWNGSNFKKIGGILSLAAMMALTTPSFWQTEIPAKDLSKQNKAILKDLKKDAKVAKAADVYDVSKGKVVDGLKDDINYLINDLIPIIYVDHNTMSIYCGEGLNQENTIERLYLNKRVEFWSFSQEFGARVRTYIKSNQYSSHVPYPIGYIDDHADYLHDDEDMSEVAKIFEKWIKQIVELKKDGKITLSYPLEAIYEENAADWSGVVATDGHSLMDYIVDKKWDAQNKVFVVNIDLNKYTAEEVKGGEKVDKYGIIERLSQSVMYIAAYNSYVKQYKDYVKASIKKMKQK